MQLNFLTGYENETVLAQEPEAQAEFWDQNFDLVKPGPRNAKYIEIEKFFNQLDYSIAPIYEEYWNSISPLDDSQRFQRWLFAFMSVHTSWKANVTGYLAIKDWWKWINKWDSLKETIEDSRVGLHNNRVRYISEFAYRFWENPSKYKKNDNQSWTEFRDSIKGDTLGLGPAKTSFAIELCYPLSAKITCLDTHMFQAYGLDQTKDARLYNKLENHWVDMCTMWNVPPYIARCLYWDVKQGKTDSRYWSHVFEN